MIPAHPSLLQQFRAFYVQNRPADFEKAIEYFAVFGGLGWKVDTDDPLMETIETLVLDNYDHLHGEIIGLTSGESTHHAVLTAIAMGDGLVHSVYKRARISAETGNPVVEHLCQSGIISREAARQETSSWIEENRVSDKLHFTTPFMRFWFAFVSPLFKGIKAGDYDEMKARFENRKEEFTGPIFERLCMALIQKSFEDDPVVEIGSYWDKETAFAVLAKTASGKTVAGECKFVNAKLKKSELAKLREKCARAGFEPDIFILVSRRGFSGELKALKGESLRLFSAKSFKKLVEGVQSDEMIEGFAEV